MRVEMEGNRLHDVATEADDRSARAMSVGLNADMVNHPPHYTSHPSGIECIDIVEHYPFSIGNAIKYLWRAGLKGDGAQEIEDLKKARWYIDREIAKRSKVNGP